MFSSTRLYLFFGEALQYELKDLLQKQCKFAYKMEENKVSVNCKIFIAVDL